jgi:hypothetical protein
MKTINKIFAILISMLLVTSFAVYTASAATYFSDGNFTFSKNGDGTITIVKFDLDDAAMVVPESIFGDTVVAIDELAFFANDTVVTATFPDTLTTIGEFCFNGAKKLESVAIPKNCTNVGKGAFQSCTSLTSVTFESELTAINNQLFYKCSSLESIVLPSTVESIGNLAFAECTALKSITIPKATTSIAQNAFRNCSDVVIYGYNNSYAQEYAAENNIPFVALNEYELGDADLNGDINISDATMIQKYLVKLAEFDDTQLAVSDVDGDGVITVSDATTIQKYLAGLIESLS